METLICKLLSVGVGMAVLVYAALFSYDGSFFLSPMLMPVAVGVGLVVCGAVLKGE